MRDDKQYPPGDSGRNILRIVAGLAGLVLLAVAGWFLFNLEGPSSPPDIETPTNGAIGTDDPPMELPEPIPDPEARKSTPTPGFVDDFEEGLGPVWAVHFGDPFTTEGQLTTNVGAGIAAGDPSWRNYQIEFDVDVTQTDCAFIDSSNSVGVRVADFEHAYWFVFTNCEAAWSLFPGGMYQGVENVLPDTKVELSRETRHITITVEESKMSAYENGSLLSSIIDASFETGGIFLQLEVQTLYDNFEVTLLP